MLRVHLVTADQRARNCCHQWTHFQVQFDLNSYNLFSLLIIVAPTCKRGVPNPRLKGLHVSGLQFDCAMGWGGKGVAINQASGP